MKQSLFFTASIVLFTILGCGSDSAVSGITAAEDALNNGNYAVAITQAQAVIDAAGTSDSDLQRAYLVKGQALLGQSEIVPATAAAEMESAASGTDLYGVIPSDMELDVATAAADALNAAADLAGVRIRTMNSLSNSQQMARFMANLVVVLKMLSRVFVLTENSVTFQTDFDIDSALTYLYPSSGRSVLYYVTAATLASQHADLGAQATLVIDKLSEAFTNIGLIKAAYLDAGTPFNYSQGMASGTINSSSAPSEVEGVVIYEILQVAF